MLTIELNEWGTFKATDGSYLYWHSHDFKNLGIDKASNHHIVPITGKDQIPTHVQAYDTQRHNQANSESGWLALKHLQFVRVAHGGTRQRKVAVGSGAPAKWTTDSHTYSVFLYDTEWTGHPKIVIGVKHGGGSFLYLIDDLIFDQTFCDIMSQMSEHCLFDILSVIVRSYEAGKSIGSKSAASQYRQAFVDGRLKKRKIRGTNEYKIMIADV